jgi:hypothetical protein
VSLHRALEIETVLEKSIAKKRYTCNIYSPTVSENNVGAFNVIALSTLK